MMADGLSQILDVVAAHPWLDVEQASALAGLSRRQASRLLEQAVGKGLVQVCHIAGLCTYGALYALTRRGTRDRPAASPIGLERALLQIEPLWGARNLLAGLAQRDELAQSVSPARLSLPAGTKSAPSGKRVLHLDVLAWGTLAREPGQLPFVIEWDLGEIVTEAYRHHFDAIYDMAQRCESCAFPVWVMVTTNRARAAQLLWLWRNAALRHGMRALRFYVAEWSAVLSGQPDVWQRIGNEGARASLFQGEPGETGYAVRQFQPDHACHAPRASFSAQRVKDEPGLRHDLAHAHLCMPDQYARRVLRRIANWPLLSASELSRLLADEHETNVRPALRSLIRLDLLTEYQRSQEPARFYLTTLGVRLLAAASGMEPSRYVHYRRWPARRKIRQPLVAGKTAGHATHTRGKELDVGILLRHLQHTRDVRAFMVSLANVARHYRALRFDHQLVVWDEGECRRYYEADGRRHALVPDSGGVYRIGQELYEFFLEIDRGTMSRRKLARKFDCYYIFRQTGEYLYGGARLPRLLVVVPDEGRAHVIRKVILARARLARATPLDAWIAVQDTLDARGPAAPVWRHIVAWEMRCCFPGFENTDQLPKPLNLAQLSREVTRDMKRAWTMRARRRRTSEP